jgi:hypothetical protein
MAQRQAARLGKTPASEGFPAWLRQLRQGVEPVPDLVNETFRREVMYQDHD